MSLTGCEITGPRPAAPTTRKENADMGIDLQEPGNTKNNGRQRPIGTAEPTQAWQAGSAQAAKGGKDEGEDGKKMGRRAGSRQAGLGE
jgi:hypothetical protein